MVTPSWAVPITVIVFVPTVSEIDPEADPEETVVPFTVIVASLCVRVGVTVIEEVAYKTLTV